MVTIKDVAQRAGVSPSTVSRALSGKIPVDKETKEKVMEAVRALNYQPNVLAKGLKEGRTNTIGLIIPNIRNPVFPAVARGVEDVARRNGFTVILCNTDEDLRVELDYVDKLQKRWVDGLIFATAQKDSHHILELKEKDFPVVLLVRHMEDKVDAVISNNFKGAYEAVSYLIKTGHKKIAIVNGSLGLTLYRERFEGYKKALQDAGLPVIDEFIIDGVSDNGNGYYSMLGLLEQGSVPDAVFATSDPKAIGIIRAIKDYGLRVPEDVSVIGFDNLEISALLDPPLTTVAQPLYEMGANAANKLIRLINSKRAKKPTVDVMEVELIIRKSTR
ncbi:MAG: LacI family transcriptional regulator [Petroclostridium sp.]|nr:transcriptional regulator, LacI family [Clostridia bacterium]MDK2809397.1 LacI family transcriptional regulator [Petroclostridium sp.]